MKHLGNFGRRTALAVVFCFVFSYAPFFASGASQPADIGANPALSGIVPLAPLAESRYSGSRYPGITCAKHDIRLARTGAIYADRLQNVYDGVCLGQDTLQLHSGDVADAAFDSVVFSSSIAVTLAGGYDCDFQSNGLSPSRIKGGLTIEKGTVEIAGIQIEGGDAEGNTAPVADAGPDQTVSAGNQATLNTGGSSDADGDPLTFSWILQKPAGSQATLSDPSAACPQFTVDLEGEYVCELTVNDGIADSAPRPGRNRYGEFPSGGGHTAGPGPDAFHRPAGRLGRHGILRFRQRWADPCLDLGSKAGRQRGGADRSRPGNRGSDSRRRGRLHDPACRKRRPRRQRTGPKDGRHREQPAVRLDRRRCKPASRRRGSFPGRRRFARSRRRRPFLFLGGGRQARGQPGGPGSKRPAGRRPTGRIHAGYVWKVHRATDRKRWRSRQRTRNLAGRCESGGAGRGGNQPGAGGGGYFRCRPASRPSGGRIQRQRPLQRRDRAGPSCRDPGGTGLDNRSCRFAGTGIQCVSPARNHGIQCSSYRNRIGDSRRF